jgi:hypothetical protein
MSNAGLLVGWTRAYTGKEQVALNKFGEYLGYLTKLVTEKHIDSFEPVIVRPHGGDLNGFILVRADAAKLATLRQSDQWKDWEALGSVLLQGFGVIECGLGNGVADFMGRFQKQLNV